MTKSPKQDASGKLEGTPVKHVSTNATIAVLAAAVLLLYLVRVILLPFVVSAVVAYICSPVVDRAASAFRLPRGAVAFGAGLVLAGIAAGVGYFGASFVVHELQRAVHELGDLKTFIHQWIGGNSISLFGKQLTDAQIAATISDAAQKWVNQTGGFVALAAFGFAGFFGVLLAWVLLFYFLIGGKAVWRGIVWLIPPLDRPLVMLIWKDLDPVLRRYFVGLVIVVVYASSAAYVGLGLILHAPHAGVLAVLTGFLELVPIVGPAASAVIAGIFTLHSAKGPGAILAYIAYATALRISIDQLIGPIVLGRAARVQPSVVIFCFLAGAILFGVPGVVMAVPVALTIKVVLGVLYNEPLGSAARPKNLPRA
ncbi:MAG TPA: AI-2E family transporter [Rhizomicrobium sp.]